MNRSNMRSPLVLPVLCFATVVCAQSATSPKANNEATKMEQGYVTAADGVRLHFTRVGHGSEVVIVPNEIYMVDDFQSLAAGRSMIFYDLRNRGRSDTVTDAKKLERGVHQEVDDLESVRTHFGIERMSILAHSYPSVVAALYAMKFPAHVERVVQIGPPPADARAEIPAEYRYSDAVGTSVFTKLQALQREAGTPDPIEQCKRSWEILRPLYVARPENASRLAHWGFCELRNEREAMAHLNRNILPSLAALSISTENYAKATMPFLVIHGTHDRSAPYGGGREWARRLPDARLLTIEEVAHVPYIEERERVLAAIDAFLKGEWPVGAVALE